MVPGGELQRSPLNSNLVPDHFRRFLPRFLVAAASNSPCLDVTGESCLRNPLREICTVGSVREEISRWCQGGPKRARSWQRRTTSLVPEAFPFKASDHPEGISMSFVHRRIAHVLLFVQSQTFAILQRPLFQESGFQTLRGYQRNRAFASGVPPRRLHRHWSRKRQSAFHRRCERARASEQMSR